MKHWDLGFKKLSEKVAGKKPTWVSEDWRFKIVWLEEGRYMLEQQCFLPGGRPVKGPRSLRYPHWHEVWIYPRLVVAQKRAAAMVETERSFNA
jgi:hypothetical protein|tara:strand:+ start:1236 stop:1514 length:279 start_codon:yes stop_codon:yes gene_type:complete